MVRPDGDPESAGVPVRLSCVRVGWKDAPDETLYDGLADGFAGWLAEEAAKADAATAE